MGMKNQLATTIAIATALLTLAPGMKERAAHAVSSTILQPVSVTSSVDFVSSPVNLINQSGLSGDGYTSLLIT